MANRPPRTLSIGKTAPLEASSSALTTVAPSALMAEPVPSSRIWLSEAVGTPQVGDTVLLNVSALRRGLGTGGHALVVANATRPPADPPPAPGHIVKARYTPLQQMVLALEEQESPHHEAMREHPAVAAGDLQGVEVPHPVLDEGVVLLVVQGPTAKLPASFERFLFLQATPEASA